MCIRDRTDVDLRKRQIADYYLADPEVYQEVVAKLPKKKKFDSDGNRLSESKIYNNAVESVDVSSLKMCIRDRTNSNNPICPQYT